MSWQNGAGQNAILNSCGGQFTSNLLDTTDPKFANAAVDDYHLANDSPAINAGALLPEVVDAFDGTPRPGQPGSPGGLQYDIGPYERDGTSPTLVDPLVVDVGGNSRYFRTTTGAITYLAGAYDWDYLYDPNMPLATATAYLDFWGQTNQNLIRAVNRDPVFDTPAANPPFNTTFFHFVATRMALARSKGIYVMFPLFQHVTQAPFTSLAYCEAYAQQVVDVLGVYDNVLFEIGNELNTAVLDGGTPLSFSSHMVDVIKARQQSHGRPALPVGISEVAYLHAGILPAMLASNADFIVPGGNAVATQTTQTPADFGGTKVVFVDSDHIWPYELDHVWVWRTFMSGHNPQILDGNEFYPDYSENDADEVDPDTFDARMRIGDTRRYAARVNMRLTVPSPSLSTTGYALANPGTHYLVYQPGSGAFDVTLMAGTYDVEWFDAANQVSQPAAQVTGSGTPLSFTPPFPDAVLLLTTSTLPPEPPTPALARVPVWMSSFH